MVRIKSILAKYTEQTGVKPDAAITYTNRDYSVSETELMLAATRFSDMLVRAAKELAPHKICQYIYDLSNAFNSFYHENKILVESDAAKQAQWIALILLVLRILETCVELLGFEAPERM